MRVVVITGAAGGIGSLLVDRFLAEGDRVVAVDLDISAFLSRPAAHGARPNLLAIRCDQSRDEDCAALAEFVTAQDEQVDVLINCAGFFPITPFEEIAIDEWQHVIDVNLTGPFRIVRGLLPLLKMSSHGRIINFGSGTFFKGSPNQSHYISAKAGLIGLTRCLATELGRYGITANVITPGLTLTQIVKDRFPPEQIARRRNERALQRDQLPEDLVGAAVFLASRDAAFITGQILNVDGGSVKY
jgi:NAD(P)-dependent dehydrogenase (short-subunit alcohol dehydrogenase family)